MNEKKLKREIEEIELYKKIRKRMPPPEKVIPDKRRKIEKEEAEKEIKEEKRRKARAHALIEGRVQGVYFRSYTQDVAESNSVTGWVRNLYDDRVEAVFEGEKESIEKVIDWCRHGPPGAHVTDVSVTWQPYTGEFSSFAIRYT